jgi:hypothetical protein
VIYLDAVERGEVNLDATVSSCTSQKTICLWDCILGHARSEARGDGGMSQLNVEVHIPRRDK